MKKTCLTLLILLSVPSLSRAQPKFMAFALAQFNKTLYDQPYFYKTGIGGLGLQVYSNLKHQIRPTAEIMADLVSRQDIGPADGPIKQTSVIPGIYAGPSFHPGNRFFIAATAGPSFYIYSRQVRFAVRPSLGFNAGRNGSWLIKASYTNVFQQAYFGGKDFGYLSIAVGLKL